STHSDPLPITVMIRRQTHRGGWTGIDLVAVFEQSHLRLKLRPPGRLIHPGVVYDQSVVEIQILAAAEQSQRWPGFQDTVVDPPAFVVRSDRGTRAADFHCGILARQHYPRQC